MACAQPWLIKNPHFNHFGYFQFWKQYLEVPCGWCLNCRLDRQNWLSDACEYELKRYNYIGAFVTFTYDDIHLLDYANVNKNDFYFYEGKVYPYNTDREINYSLRRSDARDFLKRLRSRIAYYYKKNNLKNVDLCRKDFMFCQTGEYGDSFGRPHYHFVFFGLDWNFCKDIFKECWQKGFIDSKPIQAGCFKYITKYLIKQTHGEQAKQLYDDKGLERPFFTHSLGLGKGIILDQYDYIKSHNLCYKTTNDKLRPIPIYYRNHFLKKRPYRDYSQTSENMLQAGITPIKDRDFDYKSPSYRYSFKQMNEYRKQQALLRHQQLEKQCENKGVPIVPLNEYCVESFDSMSLVKQADLLQVPF